MGGFVVRTSDGVSWPLDANQLYYLIQQNRVKEPMLSSQIILKKSDIDDRNKQNTLVRVFSIAQILWFLVNCIARACQHLPVTTIELTTIGFIATTVGTAIFWFHKPADVKTQQILELDISISELHGAAGLDNEYHWYETPLDFLNPEKTYYGVAWHYCLNILARIFKLRRNSKRPIIRRPDDNFPGVPRKEWWRLPSLVLYPGEPISRHGIWIFQPRLKSICGEPAHSSCLQQLSLVLYIMRR